VRHSVNCPARHRWATALLAIAALFVAVAPVTPAAAAVPGHAAECNLEAVGPYSSRPWQQSIFGVQSWVVEPEQVWKKGEHCSIGKARLIMQTDGNFVVYDENNYPMWAADTFGVGYQAKFQPDCNLVVYNTVNQPVGKRSNTICNVNTEPYYRLAVQSDGNVVIYDHNWNWKWQTYTAHV
jgi:hypothetical protein